MFLLALSCSTKKPENLYATTEESLLRAGEHIKSSSHDLLRSIEDKTHDPVSHERASLWLPKARRIITLSDRIVNYLKNVIQKRIFSKQTIDSVFMTVKSYKNQVLQTDSTITREFENKISLINHHDDLTPKNGSEFYKAFFRNSTPSESALFLTGVITNILNTENKLLQFCHMNSNHFIIHDTFYSLIIGQSKSQLTGGETLEITAGIGEFSYPTEATAIINGRTIELGDNPYYITQIKTSKTPGKYQVPVKISFVNWISGKTETVERNLEYTVVNPCNDK